MAIQTICVTYRGIDSILQNNPQMSDPLNKFSKEMKQITGKRKKTDEDIADMRNLEIRAKIYFDEEIGIYVPSSWVQASIAGVSWSRAKIKKGDIRACVFVTEQKLKLQYDGFEQVKKPMDIVGNDRFHLIQSLKQGQVRVVKATPIFNNWSFSCDIEFDDSIINESELKSIIEYGAKFGGFGDFRPTYGRAVVEFK